MASENAFLASAVDRIIKSMAVLAAAGVLTAGWWRGWRWGAGFALGALLSWLNFRWLKQLTGALGGERLRPPTAFFLASRYLLLGGGAYVILAYTSISLPAVLAGLFVPVAAVIIEILYELIYARA